jgi:hypothetical protein
MKKVINEKLTECDAIRLKYGITDKRNDLLVGQAAQ